ncbi:MAG: hypothetical protein KDA66_16210 [Planctomycetaceae bacterium]|nr:hypothetical protein [Planctomycetaceae bacterium]
MIEILRDRRGKRVLRAAWTRPVEPCRRHSPALDSRRAGCQNAELDIRRLFRLRPFGRQFVKAGVYPGWIPAGGPVEYSRLGDVVRRRFHGHLDTIRLAGRSMSLPPDPRLTTLRPIERGI